MREAFAVAGMQATFRGGGEEEEEKEKKKKNLDTTCYHAKRLVLHFFIQRGVDGLSQSCTIGKIYVYNPVI